MWLNMHLQITNSRDGRTLGSERSTFADFIVRALRHWGPGIWEFVGEIGTIHRYNWHPDPTW
jgi:hypothetical protein